MDRVVFPAYLGNLRFAEQSENKLTKKTRKTKMPLKLNKNEITQCCIVKFSRHLGDCLATTVNNAVVSVGVDVRAVIRRAW